MRKWVYDMPMRLLLACVLTAAALGAQDDQKKAAPPPPTNLKVLKGASATEVRQVMRTFTAGLGVQCSYCHMGNNYASDENPKKETARHMIDMMQKLNAGFGDGKMHVSCYTCHRGEAEPKTAPEPQGRGGL